jgi:hypothetical protein
MTGTWTFDARGDDGLNLWLRTGSGENATTNWLIQTIWQLQNNTAATRASIELEACQFYPFIILTCNCQGPYIRRVQFNGPSLAGYERNGTDFFYHTPDQERLVLT